MSEKNFIKYFYDLDAATKKIEIVYKKGQVVPVVTVPDNLRVDYITDHVDSNYALLNTQAIYVRGTTEDAYTWAQSLKSDIVMPLRIQKERFTSSFNLDFESYKKFWKIDEKIINDSNKNILIMHPGPVNEEIEISHELVHSDKSLINLQVENGVFIRETIMRELLS